VRTLFLLVNSFNVIAYFFHLLESDEFIIGGEMLFDKLFGNKNALYHMRTYFFWV